MDDLREKIGKLVGDWLEYSDCQPLALADEILALEPIARLLAADKAANDFNERHA